MQLKIHDVLMPVVHFIHLATEMIKSTIYLQYGSNKSLKCFSK